MDRKTALSTAGAFTLTAVAAVSALSLTMGAGADTSSAPTAPVVAEPEVVTEYEVVQLDPTAAEMAVAGDAEVVYDVQYVEGDAAAYGAGEYEEEPEDEYEEDEYPEGDEEYEDEEDEDDD